MLGVALYEPRERISRNCPTETFPPLKTSATLEEVVRVVSEAKHRAGV